MLEPMLATWSGFQTMGIFGPMLTTLAPFQTMGVFHMYLSLPYKLELLDVGTEVLNVIQ